MGLNVAIFRTGGVSKGTLGDLLSNKGVAHAMGTQGGLNRRRALGTRHHCHIRGSPEAPGW